MDTTIVTAPQHYQSCTDMAVGRRVREIAAGYGSMSYWSLHTLTSELDEHRVPCSCFAVQLVAVEERLRVARKLANHDQVHEDIGTLKAERDALRGAK